MAVVTVTSKNSAAPLAPASIILGTSGDTLVYTPGQGQELWLYNYTAGVITVTVDGSTGTTVVVPGAAGLTASVAAGLVVSVAANSFSVVMLDQAPAYLQGTISIVASAVTSIRAAMVTPY